MKLKATKAAWLQAISIGVLALCVLVLTVDLLLIQWQIGQALEQIGQQISQLGEAWGGNSGGAPDEGSMDCDPTVELC